MIASVQNAPRPLPVLIRSGGMRDCKDILTIYQTTRWLQRKYSTLEQVKAEHRVMGFSNWGWLVAEYQGQAVGEIVFRTEKNPVAGTIGVITSIDVDIRYQKRNVGAQLVHAAEDVLRSKRAGRVAASSPPEAYNFWMKIKYFARGSLFDLQASIREISARNTTKVTTKIIGDASALPKDWVFSYLAPSGELLALVNEILDKEKDGMILEFYSGKILLGVGAVVRGEDRRARFVADITPQGDDYLDVVISRTARASSSWKPSSICTRVASEHLQRYQELANWSTELGRDIPVTRFL